MIQLPSEVLIDVLLLACADNIHDVEQKLYLAQVCAYWRAVALDYPTFWARIGVRTSRDAAHLAVALAYSGDCALDVALSWQADKRLLSGAEQHAVVDVLLAPKQRRRIKRLYVRYSDAPLTSLPRLLGAPVTLPALEALEIKGTHHRRPFVPRLDAPSLRALVFSEPFYLDSWDTLFTPLLEHLSVNIREGYVDAVFTRLLTTTLDRTALRRLDWNVPAERFIPTMSDGDAMQGPLVPRLDTLGLGIDTPSSDVLRFINQFRAMDPIHCVTVAVKSKPNIYGTTLPLHFLENVFFRMGTLVDLRYDDNHEEVVVGDEVGRIRRLNLSDRYRPRWNITDLWSSLARLYAIDTSLRSLRMRTYEWHGFAGAFAARPPTALTEVHVLLRHGIDVKLKDLLAEGETFDPATDTLPPPRTLHLPSLRKLVIAKDGVSDRLMWGTVYTYCVPDVTRVRDILQHIECDASGRVEVCISVPELRCGRTLSWTTQETLLDGLADKWTLCSHCTSV